MRPLPVADEVSAPYWAAAARHELHLARCAACEAFAVPPAPVCPHCHSTTPHYRFERVTGRGEVRSWTVVRRSFLLGFNELLPFVLVELIIVV